MNALDRDHDGSALDDISGLLGGSGEGAGDAILGHIFGDKRPRVESAVGRTAGLDARQVGQIMAMLAPLVMGALGKVKRQEHLDAKGLSGLLQGELQESRTRSPASLGLLGSILDSDRDGDVDAGDVARTGFGFLGKFFGKR
ncbi:MAG: DUF937 domain-containing protein [Proteobacteria bacterium]|nr:DUF937 domain-containing protein [Pseudomonadota bacterium]